MMLPELSRLFHFSINELLLQDISQPIVKTTRHYANEYTSSEEGRYSIELFHNEKEAAAFTELGQQINIRLTGHLNEVKSSFSIYCDHVEGNAGAGTSVTCQTIQGDVRAGGDLNCTAIHGHASTGGNLSCESIEGNAKTENSIACDTIQGNAAAGYQVTHKG